VLTFASGLLLGCGWLAGGAAPAAAEWLYYAASVAGGLMIFRGALVSARDRTLTVDVLVSLAVITALATREAVAAAEVVVLMGVGQLLEDRTLDRTRRSVRGLLELAPKTAWVRRDGQDHEVQRSEIRVGDLVVVRPGARVPVDGVVAEGLAEVSEAPITGEARLRTKAPGDEVFAGSLAENGAVIFRAEHVGPDTTLARMAALVEEAQMRQAPVARQVDRFASLFIPVTLAVASLVLLVTGDPRRAVTILIGACPCALVLSTPVAVYAAIGAASRRGLLVKGGLHLERLGRASIAALDKTGTLTRGELEVADMAPSGAPERLLALAASVERLSEHAAGKAIVRAATARGLPTLAVDRFEAVPGAGVRGVVGGETIVVGAARWVADLGITIPAETSEAIRNAEANGSTAAVVAQSGLAIGLIVLSDRLRPDAAAAVAGLQQLGMRVILLSGDAPAAVSRIAGGLGLVEFRGGLMPAEKAAAVAGLSEAGGVVMVGDGINDAPALAAASVGVAVGRSGSDLAIEAADVVLLADDLTRLPELIRIGRLALANIRANLAVSGLAIAGLMAAAALGLVGPATGALIHEGSAMLVILNAMRLLRLGAQEPFGRGAEVGDHEAPAASAATAGH
jgi:Cd2+/Zn2+-exporting ATPase